MQSLTVCVSVSNGSTRTVAPVLAEELDGTVVEPEDVDPSALGTCDLLGFGSGIYGTALVRDLRGRVEHGDPG